MTTVWYNDRVGVADIENAVKILDYLDVLSEMRQHSTCSILVVYDAE